ncbi:MAG: hypothetical protein LBF97_05110 [Elusimicrobiota bacterium]|jgi:hypothetical protein|nr:hypothetical protein [Elusimicrobiota bacterium]
MIISILLKKLLTDDAYFINPKNIPRAIIDKVHCKIVLDSIKKFKIKVINDKHKISTPAKNINFK